MAESSVVPGFWRQWRPLVLAALLLSGVLLAFLPALQNDFVNYDDPDYVTANGHVMRGLNWENCVWAFTSSEAANWHPLTWLSHMVDCQVFGLAPWGHHLSSLLFHAVNTVLVFLLLRRLTGATGRSFIVALFFGLHPLRVESVVWVAERKDVLSTLFFMLTLMAYARYAQSERTFNVPGSTSDSGHRKTARGTLWYGVALGLFALGLMSKPMVVTLPFVLLLLDFWPLGRLSAPSQPSSVPPFQSSRALVFRLVIEKMPFLALAAASSVATFLVQQHGGAMATGVPLAARFENAAVSYCRYLGKIFWPVDLAIFYPSVGHWPAVAVVLASLFLVAVSALAVVLWRRHPWFIVGWLWFVGVLVPVIGLVVVGWHSMADRYSYLPSIGILLLLVWGGHELTRRWEHQRSGMSVAVGAGAFVCLLLTQRQTRLWRDSETVFRHAIQVTKDNYVAHNNLGTALEKQGRFAEAIREFQEVLREKPDCAEAHGNWGHALSRQGFHEEAVGHFQQALRLKPDYAAAHNDLGVELARQGRSDEALEHYRIALRLNSNLVDAHSNLGVELGRRGRVDDGIREFQLALRLQPNDAETHNNLGVALGSKGLLDAAMAEYAQAIQLNPSYARAHFNLGVALGGKGLLEAAAREFEEALRLQPDYPQARTNLDIVLSLMKRVKDKDTR